ncbi:MAG: PHP domain-containing protein [Neisseriaceae bacterium]|nr:PHP domain-containing protein [Neisseriaceae bacterium]MBP6863045.1 PHP domain-containing protein [Neisseriaceae bacterium]
MSVDLHCHSTISDGAHRPSEVMTMAHENGTTMVSLTDHDHTGGLAEARTAAEALGMRFINGTEASITWRGRSIHIVGLNFDDQNEALLAHQARVRSGRIERLARISEKLAKKGIDGLYEGALALASNPEMVGRAHMARYLMQAGHVKHMQQAFKKYLGEGKPGYVSHDWATLEDTVRVITEAGGMAVIAHPGRYTVSATALRELVREFKEAGGTGIEVSSGSHSLNEVINFALMADKFELYASAGSDFHAQGEGGRKMGCPPELPKICRPIWTQFD